MKIGTKVASAIVAVALSSVGCSSSSSSTGSTDTKCTYTMTGAFTYSGDCAAELAGGNGSIQDAGTQFILLPETGEGTDNLQFVVGLQPGAPSTSAAGSYTESNVSSYDMGDIGGTPPAGNSLGVLVPGPGQLTLKLDSIDSLGSSFFLPHGSLDTTIPVLTGPLYPDGGGPTADLHVKATF